MYLETNEIISILRKFDGMLENGGVMTTPLRQIGWLIIQGLVAFVNVMQEVVQDILSINGFFEYQEIETLFTKIQPILWGVLLIIVLYIGYQIMIGQLQEKSKIIRNLMTSLLVIFLLPTIMNQFSNLTNLGIKEIQGKQQTIAEELVLNQLTDLQIVGNNGWKSTEQINNIESLDGIDITETLDDGDIDTPYNEILKNKIEINKDGNYETVEIKSKLIEVIDEKYFRWDWNFWMIVIQLGFISATFLFTSLKVGRILFELGFHKIFASITAFLDIQSGQKLKEILKHIANTFVTLFCISLLLKLYIVFGQWLQTQDNLSEPVKVLLIVCAGLAVIDGPNIVDRVLGIDAGLQSGFKTATAMFVASKQLGKATKNATNSLSKTATSTGGFVVGASQGMIDRMQEHRSNNQTHLGSTNVSQGQSNSSMSNINTQTKSDYSSLGNRFEGSQQQNLSHQQSNQSLQSGNLPQNIGKIEPNQTLQSNIPNTQELHHNEPSVGQDGMTSLDRGSVTGTMNGLTSIESNLQSNPMNQLSQMPSYNAHNTPNSIQNPQGIFQESQPYQNGNTPTTGINEHQPKATTQAPTLFDVTKQSLQQTPIVQRAKRSYAIGRATTQPRRRD